MNSIQGHSNNSNNNTSNSNNNNNTISEQRRYIKCHDVRVYKPLAQPIEFRFYQRYTNHKARQSGIQFLTHYEYHRRFSIRRDFIDYMNWGKEQGQAHLPHRHQRVAFDFNDRFHPTRLPNDNYHEKGQFEGQDPSFANGEHPDLSTSYDPHKKVFSWPEAMNRTYTQYLPFHYNVRLGGSGLESRSLAPQVHGHTDTLSDTVFGVEPPSMSSPMGRVPGIHIPYKGEMDRQQMQAMSVPLVPDNTITANDGRFSKTLYLNNPTRDNVLTKDIADNLNEQLDAATNGVYSKLTVLKAAQSGVTDAFCSGADLEQMSFDLAMAQKFEKEAAQLREEATTATAAGNNSTNSNNAKGKAKDSTITNNSSSTVARITQQKTEQRIEELLSLASRHRQQVDDALRAYNALLWRVFTAPRPLMTFINGRCNNVGCGVALLSKLPALRDSTEFLCDTASYGLTPFGGITNFLARPETTAKCPGLAEFVLLTGNALYAGDALRLGWSELFTTLNDMDYYIKEWFNNTEHMHNDAVAWQLGHLLDSCFRMKGEDHHIALERCAITPARARWVEDAFADQPSVEAILQTLSQMEKLPTTPAVAAEQAQNTVDINTMTPYSLPTVAEAIKKLQKHNLHFALAPWDITPASAAAGGDMVRGPTDGEDDENVRSSFAEVFTNYVFERNGNNVPVAVHRDRKKLRAWREQRYREYQEHMQALHRPVKRHVFARIEGCDGKLIDFEYYFDKHAALQEAEKQNGNNNSSGNSMSTTDTAMLTALKRAIAEASGLDPSRPLELGWYLPTLDTARICTDDELMNVLQNDPGIESTQHPTAHPPVYFIVKRLTLHLSEWAYAVKHQLLLQSPFALKATFQMLNEVRTGGLHRQQHQQQQHQQKQKQTSTVASQEEKSDLEIAEAGIQSISETLATEFRYVSRLVRRPDFYQVGYHSHKTMDQWEDLEHDHAVNIIKTDDPLRPQVEYDEVFERDVTIDGHTFLLRPRWSPRTLAEVNDAQIAKLSTPLNFEVDGGLTEMHVPTFTNKRDRLPAAINDLGGYEVVPGLGEEDSKVAPLVSNAHVPTNVNFYAMARHPWLDVETSLRLDGHTEGSLEYMENKYKAAAQKLLGHDSKNNSQTQYWVDKAQVEGDGSVEAREESLLQDRLYNVISQTQSKVETWASTLRTAATSSKLRYPLELATQQERLYDDEYYRWFVRPGEHPNPSGLLRGGHKGSSGSSSSSGGDAELTPEQLMAAFEANESASGGTAGLTMDDAPEEDRGMPDEVDTDEA